MKIEPESDAPMLLNSSALQRIYQNVDVDEVDEETGEPIVLRFRASKEFREKVNGVVYTLLAMSIQNAAEDGRTTICAEDLPEIAEYKLGSAGSCSSGPCESSERCLSKCNKPDQELPC